MEPTTTLPENWRDFFPLDKMRPKQEKSLDFIYRMMALGIKDIVIAAPTGCGKSAIGACAAFWVSQLGFGLPGQAGAYYLCTQKLLQDQLESDIFKYAPDLRMQGYGATSLKSSSEYECPSYHDCGTGLAHKPICGMFKQQSCTYKNQVKDFMRASLAITNYAYFFTERAYVGEFQSRKMLVADECHTLENQLLKFVELVIGPDEVEKFAPRCGSVPRLDKLEDFTHWLDTEYLPDIKVYLESFADEEDLTPARARQKNDLTNHLNRAERAVADFTDDPENWVYWQELPENGEESARVAMAKPLSAAPYFRDFVHGTADVRIYMSAYPGTKDIFCQTLGLDPTRTAMLSLGSVFPKENRPIHAAFVGSMSKKNVEGTLPGFLRVLSKVLSTHADEKGLIHCNSYHLGQKIYEHFAKLPEGRRLLFPIDADQREIVYRKHKETNEPTVIISPSFTEGFDFAEDMARWQVIAKVPFPYLGDRQVSAKKERDPEWYAMKTVGTIVQASGRIVRSESDRGVTYITDSDFDFLYSKYQYLFPNWWKEALEWH